MIISLGYISTSPLCEKLECSSVHSLLAETSRILNKTGVEKFRSQVTFVTKFFTVQPNSCGSSM
jgi:hypothetical protein